MSHLSDTSPEAEEVLINLLRNKTPAEKLDMVCKLNATVRELAIQGIRERHGDISDSQVRRLLSDVLLGQDLALTVYGPLSKYGLSEHG
ncbi:MAG TPA: hypothetical protein V6D22_22540 [Candidatus Obscuribacterales bacterium]